MPKNVYFIAFELRQENKFLIKFCFNSLNYFQVMIDLWILFRKKEDSLRDSIEKIVEQVK